MCRKQLIFKLRPVVGSFKECKCLCVRLCGRDHSHKTPLLSPLTDSVIMGRTWNISRVTLEYSDDLFGLSDSLTPWLPDPLTPWLPDSLTPWLPDSVILWLPDFSYYNCAVAAYWYLCTCLNQNAIKTCLLCLKQLLWTRTVFLFQMDCFQIFTWWDWEGYHARYIDHIKTWVDSGTRQSFFN